MPRAWTTWSSKEYLSKVPCTPPPPAPWGATHPGASHGRDRPTAAWVPTMAVCPPVGRYVLTLSSPWLLRFRVVLRSPRTSHGHPTHGTHACVGTRTFLSQGGSSTELAHPPSVKGGQRCAIKFQRDALQMPHRELKG